MDVSQLLRALGLQQAYQAYQENVGQPFANIAGPFGRGLLGLDKPEYGEEQAYRTGQAMGNMPAIGAPVGAFKAAAQVPGLLVDATQMAKQVGPELAGLLGLTAFHGSPYRFSKFDASKIGTGEGAQSFGYGHYVAESPGVAESYRQKLAKAGNPMVLDKFGTFMEMVQKEFGGYYPVIKGIEYPSSKEIVDGIKAGLIKKGDISDDLFNYASQFLDKGSFYKIDLPDEQVAKMLDWDKPLGQQKNIKEVFAKIGNELSLPKLQDAEGAGFAYQALANAVGGQKNASALLNEYGIPGVRYLDQGSRARGEGTSNFVIFPGNESLLRILERNNKPIESLLE